MNDVLITINIRQLKPDLWEAKVFSKTQTQEYYAQSLGELFIKLTYKVKL